MVAVIVVVILLNLTLAAVYFITRGTAKKSGDRRENIAALNIAEAGKEKALADLRNRDLNPPSGQKITPYADVAFGEGTYTVTCSTDVRGDTIFIVSTGICGGDTARVEVIAGMMGIWELWIKGAVTSPTEVKTLGNIIIDGRDHDTNGVFVGTRPTWGVSAGDTVYIGSAASEMGGGTTPPQGTAVDSLNVRMFMDTTGYPTTPEEVLGLAPGALDGDKQSSCPSTPLSGITYLESKCSDYTGSGILIMHNSTGTAELGNFAGTFKGLVIADENKHFNDSSKVIGAVIILSRDVNANTFGNGAAKILYSAEMLDKVSQNIPDLGRRIVTVVSWRQL